MEDDDNPEWNASNTAQPDLAAQLKIVRARLAMSQSAFSQLLHIPLSSLQNWEQRRTEPDATAQVLIALVYQDPSGMRDRLMHIA
jgi:putative transcriptional regulator